VKPRERVRAALRRQPVDRVPRFEIWIDALVHELGQADATSAYAGFGQDCVLMPDVDRPGSNAWRDGVDEWGRRWRGGVYVDGVVDERPDLAKYSPSLEDARLCFDGAVVQGARARYPDHCLIFGTHIGPFMAGYMAMGFARFFYRLVDEPAFVHDLLAARTEWCLAVFREAVRLGAEVLVLGDDAGHKDGPMISPRMWREFVLPCHSRIAAEAGVPVLWHSDGDIRPLLPMAIEAGFAGVHGLEPAAGIDLRHVKREYGRDLVLAGNVDVRVLCEGDLRAVRREVDRCLADGAPGGGYMLATCNSIFAGMNPLAVTELFRYERELAA
jgi:uroporphyrinogen decarboxylase